MKYKLKELADISSSKRIYYSEYTNKGIPFYRGKEIIEKSENKDISNELFISKERYEELKIKYGVPQKGDIIMTAVGTLGKCWLVDSTEFYFKDGNCLWFYNFNRKINNKYLYYYMCSNFFQNKIDNICIGSTQKALTIQQLKEVNINIPCIETQNKIVKILDNICHKIRINSQTNDNLLELIKKLYIEKIKNNNAINFEEKNLDEFCNIFTGKKNANASEENGQYKFFTCAPEPLSINSYIYDGPAVIVAGNGAYTGRTNFYNGKFDLYQRTYGITTNNDYIYLFYAMIYTDLQNDIMGGTHGSAIPYIVMNDIAKFKVKYNKELFDELSQKIKVLLLKIKSNEAQNETLEQLRDTLLPKLMNGEIDLDKIEI